MMARMNAERTVIVVLALLILILAIRIASEFCSARDALHFATRDSTQFAEASCKVVEAGVNSAQELAAHGDHLQAAFVLIDMAALDRAGTHSHSTKTTIEPTPLEKAALMQFALAHAELPYTNLLRQKYPQWQDGK